MLSNVDEKALEKEIFRQAVFVPEFQCSQETKKKKSFKRKEGLVFDTPFAFILISFVQIMTSTATALVRDNFDSISEVKSEANCVYYKC